MTCHTFDETKYSREKERWYAEFQKHVIRFDPLPARRPWKQRSIRASFGSTIFFIIDRTA